VAETEDEMLEDLFRLCCCSLLETVAGDAGVRFRLLHVIRGAAPDILGRGLLDDPARRYASRYVRLAAELGATAHRIPEMAAAADIEAHHFGAALDWLIGQDELEAAAGAVANLTLYWATRGRHAEARSYIDRLLARREEFASGPIRELLYHGAWLALGAGDSDGAERLALDHGQAKPAITDDNLVATNSLQAQVAYHAGDYQAAARLYDGAINAARQMHSGATLERNLAVLYGHLGECMEALGDHRLALEFCEAALVESANIAGEPYSFIQAAGRNTMRGDVVRARAQYGEAMAAYERLQQPPGVAIALRGQGVLYTLQGDLPAARACLEQSLAAWRSINADADAVYDLLGCLGNLLVAEGRPEEAAPHWSEALAHWRGKGHPRWTSVALCGLARAQLAAGDLDGAAAACAEAMTVITGSQFEWTAHSCRHTQAEIAHAYGDVPGACALLAQSLAARIGSGCLPWLVDSLSVACRILADGNVAEARTACRAVTALRRWLAHPVGPVERPISVATAAATRCVTSLVGAGEA
jgi:tetratricopeptide (TPR) repeat protein